MFNKCNLESATKTNISCSVNSNSYIVLFLKNLSWIFFFFIIFVIYIPLSYVFYSLQECLF